MVRPLPVAALALVAVAHPALAQRATAPTATLPLLRDRAAFVENRGQWPDEVLFLARTGGADAWVTAGGLTLDFYDLEREEQAARPAAQQGAQRAAQQGAREPNREGPEGARRHGHVVRMRFEGGHARRAVTRGLREGYHNYFPGCDPARWVTHVPLYDEVVLEGLYDGVDLRLYEDGGHLRYDLVLAPGTDPSQIRVRMEGAEGVSVTAEGALRVATALGSVEHRGPSAYQEGDGRREAVASAFALNTDGTVGFAIGAHDPAAPLVLHPLVWSTFLGGTEEEQARGVSVGSGGAATVVGETLSADFPTTPGAYDEALDGHDAFVTRLSPDGASLLWSTFLGGAGGDRAVGVATGADASATVAGSTESADFPTTPGAVDEAFSGVTDAFVARLSADGATLLYSTFLGGSDYDGVDGLAVSPDGSATVAGSTHSPDFPATPGAFDTAHDGSTDAFVSRLSADGTALLYSTFLGGSSTEGAHDVAVGADGAATITGSTYSADFPVTPGAYETDFDYSEGFVTRLSADGSALEYSTFLDAYPTSVAVGADGAATVAGSGPFPTTPGAFQALRGHVFVTRLSADGSALRWATRLGGISGGKDPDTEYDVAVGADGSVVVVGEARTPDFPVTPGAFDETYNGAFRDAFVSRLSADGTALLYSTYLGGTASDEAFAVALGEDGRATVVGYTLSGDFPTTPGAFDPSGAAGGIDDAFVTRLDVGPVGFECALSLVAATVDPLTVAPGDAIAVAFLVANRGAEPRRARLALRYASTHGSGPYGALKLGHGTVPVTNGVAGNVTRRVPGSAYEGDYFVNLWLVDEVTGAVCGARSFTLTVAGERAATAGPETVAPFEGAEVDDLFAEEAAGALGAGGGPGGAAAWPNPAGDHAAIAFSLGAPSAVRLSLFDVLGREVVALDAGQLPAGAHRLPLDLTALSAGVYVWRLVSGERVAGERVAGERVAGERVASGHLTVVR